MTADEAFIWAGFTEHYETPKFIQYLNYKDEKEILFRKKTKAVEAYRFDKKIYKDESEFEKPTFELDKAEKYAVDKKKEELDWS